MIDIDPKSLLRILVHGFALPSEIMRMPGISQHLIEVLTPLLLLEQEGLDESLEFLKSYQNLKEKPPLEGLLIQNRIDLSDLELAYLVRLAELGVPIRLEFPFPVEPLARRIESYSDLKNIEVVFKPFEKSEQFFIYEAPDLVQEARKVAQIFAGLKSCSSVVVALQKLDQRSLVFQDALRAQGLEVSLKTFRELLGQHFETVILVDCVRERLLPPKDRDSFEINRLIGRDVLKCSEEDSLEPFWFLGACMAASKQLVITGSKQDERGLAQSMSEWVYSASLGIPGDLNQFEQPLNSIEKLLDSNRKIGLLEPPLNFALNLDSRKLKKQFGNLLGLEAEQPLSATRLEAFAQCHFKAFIEKILQIDLNTSDPDDVDRRILGQLAHRVLEAYFRDGVAFQDSFESWNRPDLHSKIWNANWIWLKEALTRLISNMHHHPPLEGAKPIAFEYSPKPCSLEIASEQVYLGGVIDRVDQTGGQKIVVDYKLSSLTALKMRMGSQQILKTHFQIPIYLRLIQAQKGYAISIKDGAAGPILDEEDQRDQLEPAVRQLLEPILKGHISMDLQESCQNCRLNRVCRVNN